MNCLLPSTKSTTSRCRIPGLRKVCVVSSAPMKPTSNILTVVIPRHKQHLLTNKHYSFWTMSVHPSYPTCRSRSDTCDGHSWVPTQYEPLEQPSEAPSSIEKAWKQGIHKEFPAVAWSEFHWIINVAKCHFTIQIYCIEPPVAICDGPNIAGKVCVN